jgi:hypothetical protein
MQETAAPPAADIEGNLGTYTPVAGATSPYTVPVSPGLGIIAREIRDRLSRPIKILQNAI